MAKRRRKKRSGVPASMRGDYPGEYKKIKLVEVPLDMTSRASIEAQKDDFGDLPPDALERRVNDRYVVETRRLDGRWTCIIEYKGERWTLPHEVFEQMARHKEAIMKAQRSDKARDAALERMEAGIVPFGDNVSRETNRCEHGIILDNPIPCVKCHEKRATG